ncbi:MAG: long-chain fatty acid--CoA ligase [Bdellovibrionales bacterium]
MSDTICKSFLETSQRLANHVAIKKKVKRKWRSHTWSDYLSRVESCSSLLQNLGLKKGDTMVIISDTRFEWAIADLACMSLGAISVPIYSNSSDEDTKFILEDSNAKIAIIESRSNLKKVKELQVDLKALESIVVLDDLESDIDNKIYNWDESISQLKTKLSLKELLIEQSSTDIASIVYTSGTTGTPKGVVLGHDQLFSEIKDVFSTVDLNEDDTSLSFLPFSHIFGRCEHFGHCYSGFIMAYAESIEALRVNLQEIQPTFLVSVPRVFEKVYNSVISAAESSPIRHKLFLWAVDVGKKVSWFKQNKKPIPIKLFGQYKIADKLVFSKLAQRMGGKLRFAVSGGAPLNQEIAEFFHAAGLLILEGYGLTETSAAVTLNTPLNYKFGSVGQPLQDAEIKIDEDGEVLIKSTKVMREYYNNPEATKKVTTEDGFFRSGDIGKVTQDGFLIITDRKKDLIKTAGGKYVAPQKLCNSLILNKYISNVLIHGDKKKYIVALITLEEEQILSWAEAKNLQTEDYKKLCDSDEVYQLVREIVAEANASLASYETIKAFHVLDHDFTIDGGQLTPSMKVKRKHCDMIYNELIEKLYGPDSSSLFQY